MNNIIIKYTINNVHIEDKLRNNEDFISDNDYDIAKFIKVYIKDFKIILTNKNKIQWYIFEDNNWKLDINKSLLHKFIAEDVFQLYRLYGIYFYENDDHNRANLCISNIKKVKSYAKRQLFIKELENLYLSNNEFNYILN